MKRVLLTGGRGSLGRKLVPRFQAAVREGATGSLPDIGGPEVSRPDPLRV